MKRIWFKTLLGALLMAFLGAGAFLSPRQAKAYPEAPKQSGVIITVTYSDPINVRGGPSTVYYPIVGQLFPGDTAPALGVSPKREWVQISYPGSPTGMGWVYATYVEVSGELPIVEAPPTPTPLATATIDPTLAAAFIIQPTQTRLPTFTPPPPLIVPTFADGQGGARSVLGVFIIALGLIGGIGLIVSFVLRK